jgi:hypothetical protein
VRDFTLEMYRRLSLAILDKGYLPVTIADYCYSNRLPDRLALIRHDVDRKPGNALRMAELEKSLGLRATYYFRHVQATFQPGLMTKIAAMGHEIGYHYETLSKARGDPELAMKIFEGELREFRGICDISTISMHGSPLSRFNNSDLWKTYSYTKYGIREAYLSIDYRNLGYLTDTGRSWGKTGTNIRDRVTNGLAGLQIGSTPELINAIEKGKLPEKFCISAHPERWAANSIEWMLYSLSDLAANLAKLLLGRKINKI